MTENGGMKYLVSELHGGLLDFAVAQLERYPAVIPELREGICWLTFASEAKLYCPSSDWATGGPIIERERIGLYEGAIWGGPGKPPAQWEWFACVGGSPNYGTRLEGDGEEMGGPTALVAAMRAFVSWKLGAEVEL